MVNTWDGDPGEHICALIFTDEKIEILRNKYDLLTISKNSKLFFKTGLCIGHVIHIHDVLWTPFSIG